MVVDEQHPFRVPAYFQEATIILRPGPTTSWEALAPYVLWEERPKAVARLIILGENADDAPLQRVPRTWDGRLVRLWQNFFAHGLTVELDPLREHPEWIRAYCLQFAEKHHVYFTRRLREWYLRYPWPGNWRELADHLLKKLENAKFAKLDFDELDEPLIASGPGTPPLDGRPWPLRQMQRQYMARVFYGVGNQYRKAAELLAVTENTLRRVLQQKGPMFK